MSDIIQAFFDIYFMGTLAFLKQRGFACPIANSDSFSPSALVPTSKAKRSLALFPSLQVSPLAHEWNLGAFYRNFQSRQE